MLGTAALVLIAATSAVGDSGNYGPATITRLPIAGGVLLINLIAALASACSG